MITMPKVRAVTRPNRPKKPDQAKDAVAEAETSVSTALLDVGSWQPAPLSALACPPAVSALTQHNAGVPAIAQANVGVEKLRVSTIVEDAKKAREDRQASKLLSHNLHRRPCQRENDEGFVDDPDVPPMM